MRRRAHSLKFRDLRLHDEIQKRIDATQTIKARTDLPLEFDRENFIEIRVQYCN